jgi:hypothetical protein
MESVKLKIDQEFNWERLIGEPVAAQNKKGMAYNNTFAI